MKKALIWSLAINICLFGLLMFLSGSLKEEHATSEAFYKGITDFEFTNLVCVGAAVDRLIWAGDSQCEMWVRHARAQKTSQ